MLLFEELRQGPLYSMWNGDSIDVQVYPEI